MKMVAHKALGLTLLGALQRQQDDRCLDYCPSNTMSIEIAPTQIVMQQPVRISGYFDTNGPLTLGPNMVANINGAPAAVDTVITFGSTRTSVQTM